MILTFYPEFKPDNVLVCAGSLHDTDHLKEICDHARFIAAADGGLKHLLSIDVLPNLLVGDQDSCPEEVLFEIETLKFPVEKDESDAELAVMELLERGHGPVAMLCSVGGRLDHTIANLQLIAANPGRVLIMEPDFIMCAINDSVRAVLNKFNGKILSLFPFGEYVNGVRTRGLKWELEGERIKAGSRGLSNLIIRERAEISVERGVLFIYLSLV